MLFGGSAPFSPHLPSLPFFFFFKCYNVWWCFAVASSILEAFGAGVVGWWLSCAHWVLCLVSRTSPSATTVTVSGSGRSRGYCGPPESSYRNPCVSINSTCTSHRSLYCVLYQPDFEYRKVLFSFLKLLGKKQGESHLSLRTWGHKGPRAPSRASGGDAVFSMQRVFGKNRKQWFSSLISLK